MNKLAIHGGEPSIKTEPKELFLWPIITEEDEKAVLDVLHARTMSGTEITKQFEREMAAWLGVDYALGYCNGTAALLGAMYAAGIGAGDEIICPSMTYWASAAPARSLGAAVNFAEIEEESLCIDPDDIEHRIGPRTRLSWSCTTRPNPCDMDRFLPIAENTPRGNEDASHARAPNTRAGLRRPGRHLRHEPDDSQGLRHRRSGHAFHQQPLHVRTSHLLRFLRAHRLRVGVLLQGQSAHRPGTHEIRRRPRGRLQASHAPDELRRGPGSAQALRPAYRGNRQGHAVLLGLLADLPHLSPHICDYSPDAQGRASSMGGWYYAQGRFDHRAYPGGSLAKLCEALRAEGVSVCSTIKNGPLHLHPVFNELDLFRLGKPSMIAFAERDLRQARGSLPHAESVAEYSFSVPWFKHFDKPAIELYAEAFGKVFSQIDRLL
jgi:dTDP-4-amino-4,6-dideoxygalactose transaminase